MYDEFCKKKKYVFRLHGMSLATVLSNLRREKFLYFRRLQPIDIDCMRQLHSRVNIVPVIGKADTLTQKELRELKKKVMN